MHNQTSLRTRYFLMGLLVKILGWAAFNFLFFYQTQEGDTNVFWQGAEQLSHLAKSDFAEYLNELLTRQHALDKSEGRDLFFTKIVSIIHLITGGRYWLTSLWFALVAFFAVNHLTHTIISCSSELTKASFFAFLLLPSPIFWSSGVLKDALVISSLYAVVALLFKIHFDKTVNWTDWLWFLIAAWLLLELRYFLFGLAMALATFTYFSRLLLQMAKIWRLGVIGGFICLAVLAITRINQNLDFSHFPQAIQLNYETILSKSDPGKFILFSHLDGSWTGIWSSLPAGLLTGLLRPFIWETESYLLLSGLENTLVMLLLLGNILLIKTIKLKGLLLYAGVVAILILASLIPLASPNWGTMLRYKSMYLPFLFFLLSITPLAYWRNRI